ncbi:MAG: tRNA (adenosine(37)-N6)-dimethylallyltransferase MiaA [Candidatus Aureabacteria bacterium]|nr:tRNA (adenosine(37)-N6)-dimethylallyltransferase MiaA [Candidatus Auribacterota bacterium]
MNEETLFIVGPTAVGKSEVAVEVALKLRGEVISADSMQVYRRLDILSAKPTGSVRTRVRHHLIDIADPADHFDVARYSRLGKEAIEDIRRRELMPIIVGGSGMYVRSLVDGIFEGGGKDEVVRAALEAESDENGLGSLYERLQKSDPASAVRIHPNDRKRIIRALEVLEVSGRPISSLQTEWRRGAAGPDLFRSENLQCAAAMFGLRRGREALNHRIEERIERMFAEGAVDEVRDLLGMGLDLRATILQSLGIPEIRECIEGRCSVGDAKEELKKNTRAFAKRQMTWFRRDPRIQWIDVGEGEGAPAIAEKLLAILRNITT